LRMVVPAMRLVWPELSVSAHVGAPNERRERRAGRLGDRRQGLGPGFFDSSHINARNPERSGSAPPPVAAAAEDLTQGGIPVKKIAVRVAALGGGIVAILLAGGAWTRG